MAFTMTVESVDDLRSVFVVHVRYHPVAYRSK